MPKSIYVLNGPNLNLLGFREPHLYGSTTLDQVRERCEAIAAKAGYPLVFRQTNHEGVLLDWLQEARTDGAAVVLNPAGFTHTSVALLDSILACEIPVVECHVTNPHSREPFRHHSYVSLAAKGVVMGFGAASYELALEGVIRLLGADKA
jgi:3-dehydroquinate dehydratase-2